VGNRPHLPVLQKSPPRNLPSFFRIPILARVVANLHYAVTLLLALALFPALKAAGLPTKVDWPRFLFGYWVGFGIQSFFGACLFCLIGLPAQTTILPIWDRYRKQPSRLFILIPLLGYLYWLSGPRLFVIISVVVVATLEFLDRTRDRPGSVPKSASALLVPAAYMFVGIALVFIYNQIVVASKFHQAHDAVLDRMDSWLLLGRTVSEVAHMAMQRLPNQVFRLFDLAYMAMMPQVGSGLVITALKFGRKRAFQYVGAVVTAYYLALLCFYLWPTLSPLYKCVTHFNVLPQELDAYSAQKNLLVYLRSLGNHEPIDAIRTAYYIAFPCMHIAQPVILLWFLRRWKRLFVSLLVYDLFLMVSIVLLEFHYVMDLVGGVAVALLTVLMLDRTGPARDPCEETIGHAT
jgi:hypothetical protein